MAGKPGEDAMSRAEAARGGGSGNVTAGRQGGGPSPTAARASIAKSKAKVTPYGAPIHTDTSSNPITSGITIAAGPALMQQNEQRAKIYNDAAREWNASAVQPSIGNFFNKLAPFGFAMEPPDVARPATFAAGDYHLGWNPGSLLGIAGAVVPGGGALTGALGQAAWTAAGLPNAVIGGPGKMGMQNISAPPSTPGLPGGAPTPTTSMAQNMMPKASQGGVPWLSALQKRPGLGQSMGV